MENNNKFDYTYSAPTESERREIEDIRKKYVSVENKADNLEKLRALDARVKNPPTLIAYVLGVVGVLIAGLGMAMVMEWNLMLWGVIVGVIGVAVAAAAYPVYKLMLARNKRKYGDEIIALTDELLNKQDKPQ